MHPVFNIIRKIIYYNTINLIVVSLLLYLLTLDNFISKSITNWASCKSYTVTQLLLAKIMTVYVFNIMLFIIMYVDYQNDTNNLITAKRVQNPTRKTITTLDWTQYESAYKIMSVNTFIYETIYWILINSYLLRKGGVCDSFLFENYSYLQILIFAVIKIPLLLFLTDVYFYITHRLFHEIKFVYQHIHKLHHTYVNPMVTSAAACHPIEDIIVNVGSGSIPCIILSMPLGFFYFWYCLAIFNGTLSHCGYTFKFTKFVGALPHDWHHQYQTVHYGAGGYCDYIFKTRLKDLYPKSWQLIQQTIT
eukprot:159356_1